jgi:hypothetical protein
VVDVPPEFAEEAWRTVPLGTCALSLGGRAGRGFLLTGKPSSGEPQIRAVLVNPDTLIVNVEGDAHRTEAPGESWLASDHLELWVGPSERQLESGGALQWGIRLSDGAVYPAHGDPKAPLDVQRATITTPHGPLTAIRIRVHGFDPSAREQLPGIALSYSHSRDGKKVEYLRSSSQLCFAEPGTFGVAHVLDPALGRCVNRSSQLDLEVVDLSVEPAVVPDRKVR